MSENGRFKGATIKDVARLARVSIASASRAINGSKKVRPELRERVLAAAAELSYAPHAAARSLKAARAQAIGVVLPRLVGEFFSELVRGMDDVASERGYVLLLATVEDTSKRAVQTMLALRGRVDALLVMAPQIEPEALAKLLPPTLPALLINSRVCPADRPAIVGDNASGMAMVVDHLVGCGYRRLAFIGGPTNNLDAQEREEAFYRALEKLLPGSIPLVIRGDFSEEAGERAAATILATDPVPDAIVAANDATALGCLHALRRAGAELPNSFALTGFDDVPMARHLGLTTVRMRIPELGGRAMTRVIDLLEGKVETEQVERYATELVVRETSVRAAANKDQAVQA